jgi:hypothetical protein
MTAFQPFNTVADWRARGYAMRTPPLILVGYDPAGDGKDRDALSMVAREEHQHGEPWDPDFGVATIYRLLQAYRMPQSMEFPDKLAMILKLNSELTRWMYVGRSAGHVICIETNGVGYAMASSLRQKIGARVAPYVTVARVTDDRIIEKRTAMPRMAALDHMRVLAETHCLKIAKGAPGGREFIKEMQAFVWGSGRPEAQEGQHDDIVMSVCGALWIGSKVIPPLLKAQTFKTPVRRQ